jgi:hypothetical protein
MIDVKPNNKVQPNHIKYFPEKPINKPIFKNVEEIGNKGYEMVDPMVRDLIINKLDISFKDIIGMQEVKDSLE